MSIADQLDTDIISFLKRHEQKELLRFVAVGSVDDGKSTLIGRLLHDTGAVYADQLEDAGREGELDFARITDGLRAEREQGITIDVAYRYFTTPRRKFIIADTPGHIQYTRNMATGASTANVAIILIDARQGVLQQSRRHAYIASLLGIPHLLVAVNKMDLVDYREERYHEICEDFRGVCASLRFNEVAFYPISALMGDNIVEPSPKTPWFTGGTILSYLEAVDIVADRNLTDFRLPVQTVLRPHLDYRGFAGQIASGILQQGDDVVVLPAGTRSRVKAIDTYDGELTEAFAPQAVVVRLEDEIDVSRGDMICVPTRLPKVGRSFRAMVVWMNDRPLDLGKTYLIKHCSRYTPADIDRIEYRVDLSTMHHENADTMGLNDIGCLQITCHRAIAYDPYQENRATGAFILIDSLTNNTVAAGMIEPSRSEDAASGTTDVARPRSGVSQAERAERLGHAPVAVVITGLPASGKSSLAFGLERQLFDNGLLPAVIDPATVELPSSTLSETAPFLARLARAGLVALCPVPVRAQEELDALQRTMGTDRVLVVHVTTPEATCRAWDARGAFNDANEMHNFTPNTPLVAIDLSVTPLDEAVDQAYRAIISALGDATT